MSVTLTPQQILSRVQRVFGDESGVQLTDTDIINWINDALREASLQHDGLRQATSFINSIAGTKVYSLDASAGVISINSVYYRDSSANDDSYYQLRYIPIQELDKYIDGWDGDSNTGVPVIYTYESSVSNSNIISFTVYPVPEVSRTNGFKVNHTLYAAQVSGLGDTIDIPAYYFNYLFEFCMMRAYEMDENWEAVDRKAQYVQSTLNSAGARKNEETSKYPMVTVLPEDW